MRSKFAYWWAAVFAFVLVVVLAVHAPNFQPVTIGWGAFLVWCLTYSLSPALFACAVVYGLKLIATKENKESIDWPKWNFVMTCLLAAIQLYEHFK